MELAVSLEGGFIRLGDTVHIGEKGFKVIKIDADRDRINALPIQSALNKTRSTSVNIHSDKSLSRHKSGGITRR